MSEGNKLVAALVQESRAFAIEMPNGKILWYRQSVRPSRCISIDSTKWVLI